MIRQKKEHYLNRLHGLHEEYHAKIQNCYGKTNQNFLVKSETICSDQILQIPHIFVVGPARVFAGMA